jgi:hypothetical protein
MSLILEAASEDDAADIAASPEAIATIQGSKRDRMSILMPRRDRSVLRARRRMPASCQFPGEKKVENSMD